MDAEVRYLDRETGRLERERVFSERELRLLYETRWGRLLGELIFTRRPFNHLYGLRARRRRGAADRIAAFVERLGVETADAELPLSAYPSLDAFFARRLRPGVRPFEPDPSKLPSPAEGRVLVLPKVEAALRVKRCEVSLQTLLGDSSLAARYAGGGALIVRLAPVDYHRFHFPAAGVASPIRKLGRRLHSVHAIALAAGAPSFANARHVSTLTTEALGTLALIEVGALAVGTIEQTAHPGRVERGAEKGTFHFGGSTVIVLTEPGRVSFDEDLVQNSQAGLETLVRVGSAIGSAPA